MNAPQFNQGRRQQKFGFGSLAGRMRRLASPLLLGGLAGTAGLGWVLAQEGAPTRLPMMAVAPERMPAVEKTHLKTNMIQLPIVMDDQARTELREIQIYVKEGAGASWLLKERLPTTQTAYIFTAPHDGEYWFKLGTVDRSGACNIADINREAPDTIVVVAARTPPDLRLPGDTKLDPRSQVETKLDLRSLGDTSDGLKVQVSLTNVGVSPSNVKFHYQTANRNWHVLEALPSRPNQFCIPCQAVLTGMVRVSATDQAGRNLTQEFNLNQIPSGTTSPAISQTAYKPAQHAEPASPPPQPVLIDPQDRLNLLTPPRDLPVVNPPAATEPSGIKIISGGAGNGPKATVIPDQVEVNANKQPGKTSVPPNQGPGTPPAFEVTNHRPPQTPPANVPLEPLPLLDKNVVKAQTTPVRRDTVAVNRHLVNHPRVSLDYQLDQVGASGVGRIDVYLTSDKGQSWQKVGEDADKKSPVEVMLPGDGYYGVSLAVTNGRGFGGNAPQPGDSPDWWIEVDSIKPTVEITGIRADSSSEEGAAFFISWTAKDKNLTSEPIDLYYSNTREGPWRPIARGLRNEGQYRWVPGPESGQQAFVRIVAHDQAANTGMFETRQAVPLDDMSRPRARPLGIVPVSQAPQPVVGSGD